MINEAKDQFPHISKNRNEQKGRIRTMSESRKSKTKTEKPKEEKKVIEEELTQSAKKQEQTEQQLQWVRNWADFLIDNERRRWVLRLVIKGGIIEDIAPSLKYCTDQEFYELMDYVFPIPQVQEFITKQLKIVL